MQLCRGQLGKIEPQESTLGKKDWEWGKGEDHEKGMF